MSDAREVTTTKTKTKTVYTNNFTKPLTLASRLHNDVLTADDLRWDGNLGFLVLGAAATPAVPALVNLLDHDSSPEVRGHVAIALSRIGPSACEAIPTLMRHMTNDTDGVVQFLSLDAIGAIHGMSERVVPVLVANLDKDRVDLAEHSMIALALFGREAGLAVPSLVKWLSYTDRNPAVQNSMRACAGKTLLQINPEAAAKAGVQ